MNGKRNWTGKEYNSEGAKIFEGEYSKGKRWKGIEYISKNNGNLKFEYEYING